MVFKERFPENFAAYAAACKAGDVRVGEVFVTRVSELSGPGWIINFPTKQHWRQPTKPEWIRDGLDSLVNVIREKGIRSVALPPLGCGNGGLDWIDVRPVIEDTLSGLDGVEVIVYQPTAKYQNVAKKKGVEKLTPARALIAEMIRRYEEIGLDCTILEIQKLAWFLTRMIERAGLEDPLDLRYQVDRYGPFSDRLRHLLDGLDGSYLHCDKRIADAKPLDLIRFEHAKGPKVALYLKTPEAQEYSDALEATDKLIDGFQSPIGMEALATVDWLLTQEKIEPTFEGILEGLRQWPAGPEHGERKLRVFKDRLLEEALKRLVNS